MIANDGRQCTLMGLMYTKCVINVILEDDPYSL